MKIIRIDKSVARVIKMNQKRGESINDTVRRLVGIGSKKRAQ